VSIDTRQSGDLFGLPLEVVYPTHHDTFCSSQDTEIQSMDRAFSKNMGLSEGRYLTALEQESLVAASLELPHRMNVSRMLQQFEFEIVDYATHAYCDTVASFDAPAGSLRRKKGHQDGRIILRYAAQAVREGSCEIVFEKVLVWLIGHLDSANVNGADMEVFFHFINQGVHRELPAHAHPYVDRVFDQMYGFIRQASASGTIHRAHRRIAEFAVDRLMSIMPDAKARYGVASVSKCKRDFELFVKEIARVMRTPSPLEMKKQMTQWLIEKLVSQVEYDPDVWYWSFLAIREGIVHCCEPEACDSIYDLFETLADNSSHLMESIQLANQAGTFADTAAARLLQRGEPLGLLRADEFQTVVAMCNRELISAMATLHACCTSEEMAHELAKLWCGEVLPLMPSSRTSLLAANLKVLLEVVEEEVKTPAAKSFRTMIMHLVDVARKAEAAIRLTSIIDQVAVETSDWAIENHSIFASDRRASYRDVRLVLSKAVCLIPYGPAGINGVELRSYVTDLLLPNLSFNVTILRQVYERAVRGFEHHAGADDLKIIRGYLDDLTGCFDRYQSMHSIAAHADRYAVSAVERGYQASSRHDAHVASGIKAGRRDGKILVEKTIKAAIVGGPQAEAMLHEFFRTENVRMSNLPGSVVVEFVRGLLEQLREYPMIGELLLGLAHAAPAYTAAAKINEHSEAMAQKISIASVNASPVYKEQLGEVGLEACARDNAVMLRGLARSLVTSPADVSPFKAWWKKRIGKNIRQRPENFDESGPCVKINFNELISTVRSTLDRDEADTVESYLKQIFAGRSASTGNDPSANRTRMFPNLQMSSPIQPVTFADVIA